MFLFSHAMLVLVLSTVVESQPCCGTQADAALQNNIQSSMSV
jgi:hypothetical protein